MRREPEPDKITARISGHLTLLTGTPGAGKTLRAMWYARAAKRQGRRVVGNVDGADPEIMEALDGEWFDYPPGTLVIIDEAQEWFRPASPHASLTQRVKELERRRHTGVDVICTTQHPKFVHHNVRRLATVHEHFTRESSAYTVNVKWSDRGAFDPDDHHQRESVNTQFWRYPKDLFQVYQSAEVHTNRPRVPHRLMLGLTVIVVAGGVSASLFSWAVADFYGGGDSEEVEAEAEPVQEIAQADTSQPERERTVTPAGGIATADDSRCRLVDQNGRNITDEFSHAECLEIVHNNRW